MKKRMLLTFATCVSLGLSITLAQESPSAPEASPPQPTVPNQEGIPTQKPDSIISPIPKVSALTPMTTNVLNVIFWAKTIDEFKKPNSAVHDEVDQLYPGAIFAEIKPLDTAFDTNEVRANRHFKGKWIWIVGKVGKISDSEEKGPSMVVQEIKDAQTIKAFFANQDKARDSLEILEPGQLTSLMCRVSGLYGIQVQMKDCEFFDPMELKTFQRDRARFFEALEGKGDLIQNAPIALVLLTVEDSMSEELKTSCAKSEIDCIIAFSKNPRGREPDMDKVIKQFEALGYSKQMIKDNPDSQRTIEEIGRFFS